MYDDLELGPRGRQRFGQILREIIIAAGVGQTHIRNRKGQPPRRRPGTSGYTGVHKSGNMWTVRFMHEGEMRYFGYFDDPEEAARVHDDEAYRLKGSAARLNFSGRDTLNQGAYTIARALGDLGYATSVIAIMDGEFDEERYTRYLCKILSAIEEISGMSEQDIYLRVPDADLLYSFCRGE